MKAKARDFMQTRWFGWFFLLFVLASLLLLAVPTAAGCRERARRIQCLNNLRQIGLGIKMYAVENSDQYPEGGDKTVSAHFRLLSNMVGNAGQIFKCPEDKGKIPTNVVTSIEDRNISYCYVRGLDDSAPIDTAVAFDRGMAGTAADGLPLTAFGKQPWGSGCPHTEKIDVRVPLLGYLLCTWDTKRPQGGNVLFAGAHVSFNASFPPVAPSKWTTNVVEVP